MDCDTYIVLYCLQGTTSGVTVECLVDASIPAAALESSDKDNGAAVFTDLESQADGTATPPSSAVSSIMVKIDKYKMEQVVRNFMTNALKFTPHGGTVTVNVTLRDQYSPSIQHSTVAIAGWSSRVKIVRLEVTDTGPGISEVL